MTEKTKMGFTSWKGFILPFFLRVFLNGLDVITDCVAGVSLYQKNYYYGALVIYLIFNPFIYNFFENLSFSVGVKMRPGLAPKHYNISCGQLSCCFYELPMVRAIRNGYLLVKLQSTDIPDGVEGKIQSEMKVASMSEFVLESVPQAVFQVYLMVFLSERSYFQLASIIASFVSGVVLFVNLLSDELKNENPFFFCYQLLYNAFIFAMVAMHSMYWLLVSVLFHLFLFQVFKVWLIYKHKNEDSIEELKKCRIVEWLASTTLLHKTYPQAFVKITGVSFFVSCFNLIIISAKHINAKDPST